MIQSLSIHSLHIPFKTSFKHASATRDETSTVWVQATSHRGYTGFGESCPRSYVTGETLTSAKAFFDKEKASILSFIESLASLQAWSERHRNCIDNNPAAWCAIELALLDLMAKEAQCSVEKLLGLPELSDQFYYSAVLGDASEVEFKYQYERYRGLGFKDYKIKLAGDWRRDTLKLTAISVNHDRTDRYRFDANNLFDNPEIAADYLQKIYLDYFAVEEPIAPNQYKDLESLALRLNKKIILDESFLRREQFSYLSTASDIWIINVRVSKMGGILRSLAIIDQAKSLGIPVIVGAQVGESSLLTRAGMLVARYAGNQLVAHEGAFGAHLLAYDVCQPSLTFQSLGILPVDGYVQAQRHGFGLEINLHKIRRDSLF